jgi:ELWxxDGT repeat protein
MRIFLLYCLISLFAFKIKAQIHRPYLFKDLNTTPALSNRFMDLCDLNGKILMSGADAEAGTELWISDGTSSGSYRLKDIFSGREGSFPRGLTKFNDKVYFFAAPNRNDGQLWVSDGTASGTRAVYDFQYTQLQYSTPKLITSNGLLFIIIEQKTDSISVYRSDGTTGGTFLLKKGSRWEFDCFNPTGTSLFFTFKSEVWKTDGTVTGTLPLYANENVRITCVIKDKIFLSKYLSTGMSLYIGDTLGAPLSLLKDSIDAYNYETNKNFVEFNNTIYFTGLKKGEYFYKLWKTDGTATGTVLVSDTLYISYLKPQLTIFNNNIYFFTENNNKYELWRTDGTESGSIFISGNVIDPWKNFLLATNNRIFFNISDSNNRQKLAGSDGSNSGTYIVNDSANAITGALFYSSGDICISGNDLFFNAFTGKDSISLWKTNGSIKGTKEVLVIKNGTQGSDLTGLLTYNDQLYITEGNNLWISNGNSDSTKILAHLDSFQLSDLFKTSKYFYFIADKKSDRTQLWRSDGTSTNTVSIIEAPSMEYCGRHCNYEAGIEIYGRLGEKLIFTSINKQSHQKELFITDGSVSGTTLLKSIGPLNGPGQEINNLFVFGHNDSVWVTDGTPAGTRSIYTIDGRTPPSEFTYFNGRVYFKSNRLVSYYSSDIYSTDGTEQGTKKVKTLIPPTYYDYGPTPFTVFKDNIYFVSEDSFRTLELWQSNGTEAGTFQITNINYSMDDIPRSSTATSELMYFMTFPSWYDMKLWITDGTEFGTKEIYQTNGIPMYTSMYPGMIKLGLDNGIFFTASGIDGLELWISNGTTAGTCQLMDIMPGYNGSDVKFLTYYKNAVYFAANDGLTGLELWKMETSLKPIEQDTLTTLNLSKNIVAEGAVIYPNPSRGIYNIKTPASFSGTIKVCNELGETIHSSFIQNQINFQIDISSLNPGIYFITGNDEAVTIKCKILKQ